MNLTEKQKEQLTVALQRAVFAAFAGEPSFRTAGKKFWPTNRPPGRKTDKEKYRLKEKALKRKYRLKNKKKR